MKLHRRDQRSPLWQKWDELETENDQRDGQQNGRMADRKDAVSVLSVHSHSTEILFHLKCLHMFTSSQRQTQISSAASMWRYNFIRDQGTEAERDGVIDGWK